MNYLNSLEIIRPDDWHTHLREGDLLKCVINSYSRVIGKCIVMPNLKNPINKSSLGKEYKKEILSLINNKYFKPFLPCYLTDDIDSIDFENALKNEIFIGAKLYPINSTTNSSYGVSNIENIYPSLESLVKFNKPLLIHGEKISEDISIFDREKYFIDDQLIKIINDFPNLKIVLEHVSSEYGANFVAQTNNIYGTITPHHMILTKKDVFKENINAHHYCMPVVKEESDLVALRNYACSGNEKFFIGTDSAPHDLKQKENTNEIMPGIFSAPCSIELYTEIFDQENSLNNLEKFTSINGAKFYNLEVNKDKIKLLREKWKINQYTEYNNIKVKNFYGGNILNWRIEN